MIRELVTKRQLRWALWLLVLTNIVLGLLFFSVTYPVEWRFKPSAPSVADTQAGTSPEIIYYREIKVPFLGSYAGTVRAQDGDLIYFDFPYDQRPPFPYNTNMTEDPTTGALIGKTDAVDLCWWTGDHPLCNMPKAGAYYIDTCWQLRWYGWARVFNVLKPRFICRKSNVFTVFAGEDIESSSE